MAFSFHHLLARKVAVPPGSHLVSMRKKEPMSSTGHTPALSSTSRLLVTSMHSFKEYSWNILDSWNSRELEF